MTVNNVNALLNLKAPQAAQPEQAGPKQDDFTRNSFGQVMTKVNDKIRNLQMEAADVAVSAAQPAEIVDTAKTDGNTQVQETDKTVHNDSVKAQQGDDKAIDNAGADAGTEAVSDEAVEEVEEAAKELVQKIVDEMDVTPEEVEAAMAILGLTPVELFDIDNLKQLMLTIAGSGDELTLVTDGTLYDSMQNLFMAVEGILEGLREELGLNEEELGALMEQIVSLNEGADMEAVTSTEDVPVQEAEHADEMPEVNLEGMKDYTVSIHKDGETVQMKVTVDDASGAKSVQEEVTDVPRVPMQGDNRTRERDASADSGRGEGNAFMQSFDKPAEVTETPAPVSAGYQSVQTEDIMNQIMDYMRINLKADMQEMELRLHPASLGTVNVQIAAKDGAVTAHFTTQNEAVRAVIETQLIQLKQQFEEQGIKVDAVEVTVANHEYGQQFSQENSDAAEKQDKSGKSRRRINLDEIDEEEDLDEMEESERIAVEMMRANGSTVDFTA